MTEHVLTYMTFLPLAGAVVVLLLPSKSHDLIRWVSAAFTVPPLLLAAWLFTQFDPTQAGFQFEERVAWIPAYNIQYYVGVDGLSISMVLLTALLCFLCIFASWGIDKAVKGYFALYLLLDTGMMGVFVALDFFLFYIFWEVMLLPMYFLIGIWGGPRREYAAIKFFLYTLFGSVLMLLAILALYFSSEPNTFDMTVLMAQADKYGTSVLAMWPFNELGWSFQHVVWMALFIGFAIKIPAFPFHTWLPDAHVEAPTAISVILAGILLKMGTYGILRINYPMLPVATADLAYWFLGALLLARGVDRDPLPVAGPRLGLRTVLAFPLAGSKAISLSPAANQTFWPSYVTPCTLSAPGKGPYSRTISAVDRAMFPF